MFVVTAILKATAPSPWAPRVNVRWIDGIADATRDALQQRYGLIKGVRDDGTTWAYDLTKTDSVSVIALVSDPSVADTHFIDRGSGTIDADAARGTTPLQLRGLARLRNSALFLWFVLFWLSSLLVSGAWLHAAGNTAIV